MDRNAIKMLRYIRESDVCAEGYCRYDDFYPAFEAETGWKHQRVMCCVRYLEKHGYISYCEDSEGNHAGFELEHKAYHTRYFAWVSIRDFLVRSFLVPIAVSAVTAYITVLISSLMDSAA